MKKKTIEWTNLALKDLESIHLFISKESISKAKNVIYEILNCVDKLRDFPEIGRVIPHINEESYREIFVFSFRIMYKIDKKIFILGIRHMSREFNFQTLSL